MSAGDDIQFDMSAALVGVMVVLFFLVYEETRFEQSPGDGVAQIELLYLEDPLPNSRYHEFTWPAVESEGSGFGGIEIFRLQFSTAYRDYEYSANSVSCQIDEDDQAVWIISHPASSNGEDRVFQGSVVSGDFELQTGGLELRVPSALGTGLQYGHALEMRVSDDVWGNLIPPDRLTGFFPDGLFVNRFLWPTMDFSGTEESKVHYQLDGELRSLRGRFRMRVFPVAGSSSTIFDVSDPNAPIDRSILRAILEYPLISSLDCSVTAPSIHSASSISLVIDPPNCSTMLACTDGFQDVRIIGLRYRTPSSREWTTWVFTDPEALDAEFEPNASRQADGYYLLSNATRITVELN